MADALCRSWRSRNGPTQPCCRATDGQMHADNHHLWKVLCAQSVAGLVFFILLQTAVAEDVQYASQQGTLALPKAASAVFHDDGDPQIQRTQAFGPALLGGIGPALTASPVFNAATGRAGSVSYGSASALAIGAESQVRLASVPDMFGDFFIVPTFSVDTGVPPFDVPIAGATGRAKISDHNKAIPVDRVFFNYHHFHNALATGTFAGGNRVSIDRFTVGGEKTFEGGRSSLEVRLPITTNTDFVAANGDPVFGGNVGNLFLAYKRLLFLDERTAVAAGAGLEIPTGSDATTSNGPTVFRFENHAVFLSPYFAIERTPTDNWFWNMFSYLDVALNEYDISRATAGVPGTQVSIGDFRPQLMWHLDLSTGVWLYRTPISGQGRAQGLTGVAAIAEVHYAATLEDASNNVFALLNVSTFGQSRNNMNIVNLTSGLHFEINRHTTLRFLGAFPIRSVRRSFL